MKRTIFQPQPLCRLALMALAAAAMLAMPAAAQEGEKKQPDRRGYSVPSFRHIDPATPEPDIRALGRKQIRILTEDDFPPFSYRDRTGAITGFSITLVNAVCKDLRLRCRFIVKPFAEVLPALQNGEGDIALAGIRPTPAIHETLAFTRPYFRYLARFAVRTENTVGELLPREIAGKRIGVVTGSAHEAFLKAHYSRSVIRGFESMTQAGDALRTAAVDALFADGIRLMFWINGSASRGCCRFAGGAYTHPDYFTNTLDIAARRDDIKLVRIFDHGLDRQQLNGGTARLFRRFFPASPW